MFVRIYSPTRILDRYEVIFWGIVYDGGCGRKCEVMKVRLEGMVIGIRGKDQLFYCYQKFSSGGCNDDWKVSNIYLASSYLFRLGLGFRVGINCSNFYRDLSVVSREGSDEMRPRRRNANNFSHCSLNNHNTTKHQKSRTNTLKYLPLHGQS